MEAKLIQFTLPVSGLKNGIHRFDFKIDRTFFACFPDAYIQDAAVDVQLEFDKRAAMYVLDFELEGKIHTICDRCSEKMWLDIESREQLLVKFSEEPSKEAEVVHIPLGTEQFNVSQYIYEFVCLAIPMIKTHEDVDENCDETIMQYLNPEQAKNTASEVDNPFKNALKNLNLEE